VSASAVQATDRNRLLRCFGFVRGGGTRRKTARRFRVLLVVAMTCFHPWLTAEIPAKEVRRVLIFNTYGPLSSPGVALMDRAIVAGLEQAPYQIELYSENLETTLFPDEEIQRQFLEWSIRKYRDRKPDVIIAVGREPLKLLVESHNKTFPGVPIVFCGSTKEMLDQLKLDSSFTGVWGVAEPEKTLIAALRLQPSTKHVVVVGGVGAYDRELESIVKKALHSYESKLEFTYLTDLEMPTLRERLRHLPNGSIVYHTSLMQDAAGTRFIDASQSVPLIASAANAPVFVVDDVDLGRGTVGGDLLSFDVEGRAAAAMAVRVLNGETPANIPIVESPNAYMFDWLAMQRWGLKESDLPPGSVVLNRRPTLWESYRWYILGGILLIVAETLLTLGLLWQRARRRKVEEKLHASEKKLAGVVASAMDAIIAIDEKQRVIVFNPASEKMFGCTAAEAIGSDLDRFIPQGFHFGQSGVTNRAMGAPGEPLALRANGEEFPIEASISQEEADGEKMLTVIIRDITERKMAEAAIVNLSGQLIQAQEAERSRIAREIHDDFLQRLAVLSIELSDLTKYLERDSEGSHRLRELRDRVGELSSDLHSLSHRLHSSTLDNLGLIPALTSLCMEFGDHHSIDVDFVEENVPPDIPKEVALCLFRITQEALQNIKKHSHSDSAVVWAKGLEQKIHLSISDRGAGFDQAGSIQSGIGIQSMEERVRLVGGQFAVHSRPMEGTTIDVWVPIASDKFASHILQFAQQEDQMGKL
jgi:PAS domain S-box-containing protein